MNRGSVGRGGGRGGPTNAASSVAAERQKCLLQWVDTDIGNLVDNFAYIVNVARVNNPPVRNSQESFMMEMRGARMVQAADSLLKLVSELKQGALISGFGSLNEHVDQRIEELNKLEESTKGTLSRIREEAASSLTLLFYTSDAHATPALRERGLIFLAVDCFN